MGVQLKHGLLWLMLAITAAPAARAGVEHRVIELKKYGIMVNVTEDFDGTPTVTAQCLIPLPREIVWNVLSDYENLDAIVPAIESSKVIGEEDGRLVLRQEGRAGMWFVKREFTVTFRVDEKAMASIDFEAFEGDFETFTGKWRVKPMRAGTLIRHEVQVVPKLWAPGWALRKIAGDMMMETLRGVVGKCFETAGRARAGESSPQGAAPTQ
jgi:ribosome-associated toxin RatA of RatAB toxin-antitoxin module